MRNSDLSEYYSKQSAFGVAEHTNLSLLKMRMRRVADSLSASMFNREELVAECRHVCNQLQEIADRQLAQVSADLSNISATAA